MRVRRLFYAAAACPLALWVSGCGPSMGEPVQGSASCHLIPGDGPNEWIVESIIAPKMLAIGVVLALVFWVITAAHIHYKKGWSPVASGLFTGGLLLAISFTTPSPYTTINTIRMEATHVTRRGIWRVETGRETVPLNAKTARFATAMLKRGKGRGPGVVLHTGKHRIAVCPPWTGNDSATTDALAHSFNVRALSSMRVRAAVPGGSR